MSVPQNPRSDGLCEIVSEYMLIPTKPTYKTTYACRLFVIWYGWKSNCLPLQIPLPGTESEYTCMMDLAGVYCIVNIW
jgi:hypothetical protein